MQAPQSSSAQAEAERARNHDHLWFDATPGQGSWRVQVHCRGQAYAKRFPVLRYGSHELALDEARAWRDEILRSLHPYSQQERVQWHRSNNTSGAPGVYRMKTSRCLSDGSVVEYIHWEARTPEGIKPSRKKAFSVRRYGDDRAYELAVAAREAFVHALGD